MESSKNSFLSITTDQEELLVHCLTSEIKDKKITNKTGPERNGICG